MEEAGATSDGRRSRDDLVQVEYALYSLMLDEAEKKRSADPQLVAADFLGTTTADLVMLSETVPPIDVPAVQLELARQIAELDPSTVVGATPSEPVTWSHVERRTERLRVPEYVSAPLPAGTASSVPLYLRTWPQKNRTGLYVQVFAGSEDEGEAGAYLEALLAAAKGERSPYFHDIIEAFYGPTGLALRFVDLEPIDRESLVLGPTVWEAVRRNVDRMFERMDRLSDAGLGTNRGLVLAGAPGTGKSALCRALAHQYRGQATVTIMSASAGQHLLGEVYERMNDLGPALVLLEDLDLLVGDREEMARAPLVQFLTVLDGLMTHHSRVVTIATTNDAELIDEAALRAARFDQVVELDLPDHEQRAAILSLYLREVAHDADLPSLVRASEGFSGADLRELVRSAVLDTEHDVVQHADLATALDRRRLALGGLRVGFVA